jgi:hypothetical protein
VVFLGSLRVYSEGEPDESLVRLLRDNKQAVMDAILAAETEPDRWRRALAEKVETIMQPRGLTRHDAEREAFRHLMVEYLNETHPNTDPTHCAHCSKTETPDATLLPLGWGERHAWLYRGCWEAWRAQRRVNAEDALPRPLRTRLQLPSSRTPPPPPRRGPKGC